MEEFINQLERKIEGCDALGGMGREKAVYQSVLKDYKKAIAVTPCCTELKADGSTLTFKGWLKENGYYKKGFEWFNKHGYSRDFDKLKKYYELSDCY